MNMEYFFCRRHEMLTRDFKVLDRIRGAYSGGECYIRNTLIRHISEPEIEFKERLRRAIYINHPRHIAQLISRFVLSIEPNRTKISDKRLMEDWSRNNLHVNEVMLQLSTILNCYGFGWLFVDYPAISGKIDMATKQQMDIRPFVRALAPFSVVDWYFDDNKLQWAIVEEHSLDKSDPFSSPINVVQRRLWTPTEWILYQKSSDSSTNEISRASHNLGQVPLILVDEPDGHGLGANHWFEDIVRVSDALINNESEAQMNIIKQMFGLLVIPEALALTVLNNTPSTPELSTESKSFTTAIARSAALWERPDEKGIARYISPSGTETATIRSEINELKKSLYEIVGLALQSSSKTQQTAESKSWDNHNVQQFLAGRATLLERAERQAWQIMQLWDSSIEIPDIAYNREFAVEDLASSVAALLDLSSFDAGDEFKRATNLNALSLLDKLFHIPPDMYQKITNEIKNQEIQGLPIPEQNISVDEKDKDKPNL